MASVNDAPVANDDTRADLDATPVTDARTELVGNDTDPDGDTLTIASVTSESGGTGVLNSNGTVTFTAGSKSDGVADVTYT